MSQFQPAYEFVMDNEDAARAYAIVPDVGGFAISGINSASFPEEYADIASVPQSQRGPAVANFYQTKFWTPLNAGGIADQDLANRVLDEAVNAGLQAGAVLLQRAANACGVAPALTVDGQIGPLTLEAVNKLDPQRLLAAYRAARVFRYEAILQSHPDDALYAKQWMARAEE